MRFGKKKKFGSSPRKASKPTGPDPFIGSAAHPSASEEDDLVTQNLEEIKSMREEINWRVKNAYTGSIIFISGVSLIVGSLFTEDNKFLERIANDPEAMTLSGIAIMLAISAWAGVQNANHLIEKKIELYTLELMKVVYEKKKQVYFSWLGYLYGNSFFVHPGKQAIGKFLNASIGMFIYLLPNVIALFVWGYVLKNGQISNYFWLFLASSIFTLVAAGSTLFFFFYVVRVNKQFTAFYERIMVPYFEKNGIKY